MLRSVDDNLSPQNARRVLDLTSWQFYPATRLLDGKTVWLPLDWFKLLGEFNGTSAGNSREESLLQGLSELIERHVCCRVDRNQPTTPTIDPASCSSDPVLAGLLAAFEREGVRMSFKGLKDYGDILFARLSPDFMLQNDAAHDVYLGATFSATILPDSRVQHFPNGFNINHAPQRRAPLH